MHIKRFTNVGEYVEMLEQGAHEFVFDKDYRNNGFKNLLRALIIAQVDIVVYINGGDIQSSKKLMYEVDTYTEQISNNDSSYEDYVTYKLYEEY